MVKAFVFDMDGVLLDTESICDRTWMLASKFYNIDEKTALESINLCRGTNKAATRQIVKNLFPQIDTDEFLAKTSEFFGQIEAAEGIKTLPFAKECLEHLKNKGYRLALASSTRGAVVERQLKNAGLIDYFEHRVTGDQVQNSKPDPEIYVKACQKLELSPSECIAIEDSPNGLKSAKSAGLVTIMVPDRIAPNEETAKVSDYVYESLQKVIENF